MQVIQAQLYPGRVTAMPWPSKQAEKDLETQAAAARHTGRKDFSVLHAPPSLTNITTHAESSPSYYYLPYRAQGVPGNLHLTVGPDRVRYAVHPVLRRGSMSPMVILSGVSHPDHPKESKGPQASARQLEDIGSLVSASIYRIGHHTIGQRPSLQACHSNSIPSLHLPNLPIPSALPFVPPSAFGSCQKQDL